MATTEVTLQEDAWVQISTLKAFTAQNNTVHRMLIQSAASLPAASSELGFVLERGEVFQNGSTAKTWYGRLFSSGTDTAPITIDED